MTFADHDELYFSLTEDIRELRIDRATATVRLPIGAQIIFADGYAGFDKRKDFTVSVKETEHGDVAEYEVTRPLRKDMQFILSIAFLKGYVDLGPLHEVRRLDRQEGHIFSSFAIAFSGLFMLSGYYYFMWRRVGRDSTDRTVLTVYDPPDGMGPAEIRHLYTRGKVDYASIAATILRLAEVGGLSISERQGIYRIERCMTGPDGCTSLEKEFQKNIFSGPGELTIGHAGISKAFASALHTMRTGLKKGIKGLQRSNGRYLWTGIAISLITIFLSFAVLDLNDFGKEKTFKNIYLCTMITVMGGVNLMFKWLLRSPTEAYTKLLDRIAGYRLFLETSFNKGASQSGGIQLSLQRHLPNAVALGIDCGKITIRQGQTEWYSGSTGFFSVGEFLSSINKKGWRKGFDQGRETDG